MESYELLVIARPDLESDGQEKLRQKISKLIEKHKGTLGKVDLLGRRELAYPLKNYTEGVYFLVSFELEKGFVRELEKELKLMGDVLRFMITARGKEVKSSGKKR